MLGCTSARLDELMGGRTRGEIAFFTICPFSFCASWIAVLTFILRGSLVTLNTDLTKIPNDMPAVAPHYFSERSASFSSACARQSMNRSHKKGG